jgi:hypothetical protein
MARLRPHSVVLVEGDSDVLALRALAQRRRLDLARQGVEIVPIGGATGIGTFLAIYGPRGMNVRVGGLCDAGEEWSFRRALAREGFGDELSREAMDELGFAVCVVDLEDELIRALGVPAVERVMEAQGDLRSWHTMQKQPAQLSVPVERQLRRFMGTKSARKATYAPLLVNALDLDAVPPPLDRVLAHACGG